MGSDRYNTRLSRLWSIPKSCPNIYEPCFIYPTLPHEASTSVFINVHTHIDINKSINLTLW